MGQLLIDLSFTYIKNNNQQDFLKEGLDAETQNLISFLFWKYSLKRSNYSFPSSVIFK